MPKKINWQWLLGIAATVIAAGILSFISWIFGAWGVITVWLKTVCDSLICQISIPLWLLAILVVVSSCSIIFFIITWIKSKKQPSWMAYTEDIFDEILWRWEYSGKNPENLSPHCPDDDTVLDYPTGRRSLPDLMKEYTTIFICKTCDKPLTLEGTYKDIEEKICRQIIGNIRNGKWKQVVEEKRKKTQSI